MTSLFNKFAMTCTLASISGLLLSNAGLADWPNSQQMDRMNKWFDDASKKKYEIQKPGEIQKAGEIQVPRGIQAIKRTESPCKHRFAIGSDTLFEFDKSTLTPQAEITLKVLGPMLVKEGKHPVTIEGHTDSIGSVEYNQKLSEGRAQSVNAWLSAHQFLLSTPTVKGFGKNRPIAPNVNPDGSDNPAGRQKNRRVEIVVDTCHNLP